MSDQIRPNLTALRNGLLQWHKSLLDSERAAYERDVARITTTGQYLQLVLDDPWFAWLREISQFIVIVDRALGAEGAGHRGERRAPDREGKRAAAARRIRHRVRAAIRPSHATRSRGCPGAWADDAGICESVEGLMPSPCVP